MDIPLPPSEPDSEGLAPDETPRSAAESLDHPVPTDFILDDIPVPSLPPRDYPAVGLAASSKLKGVGDPSQPTVLGKSAAKKRLLAFSKQSLVPPKKLKPDDKGNVLQEKPAFKKKKVKSEPMERAKETISEIEELKRLEQRELQKLGRSGRPTDDYKSSSRGRPHLEADSGPSTAAPTDPMVSRKLPSVDNFVDEILMKKRAERVRRETDRSRRDSDRDRRHDPEDREKRNRSKLKERDMDKDKDKNHKDDKKEREKEKKDKDKERRSKVRDHHHDQKDKKEKLKKEDIDPKSWNELKLSEYSLSDLRRARRKLLKQMADSMGERFDEKVIQVRKYCEVEDFLNPRAQRNHRAPLSFEDEPDPGVWCVKSALVDEDYKELEVVLPPVSVIDELPLAENANPEPKFESDEPKTADLPPVEASDVDAAPQRPAPAEPVLQDGLLAFEYEEFMKTIDPPAGDDDVVHSEKPDPVEVANEEAWDRETPQLPPSADITEPVKKKKKSKKKDSSEKKTKDPAKKKKKKRKRARSSSSSSSSSSTSSSSSSSSSSSEDSSDESSSSSSTSGDESKTKKRKKKSKQKLKAKKSKSKKKFDKKSKDKLKITESSPTSKSVKGNKKSKKAEKTKRKKKKKRLSLECPENFDLASLTKSTKTLEQSLVEQVTKIATLEKEYRKYEAASAKESVNEKSCPFEGIGLLNSEFKGDVSQESTGYLKNEEVILGRNKKLDVPFTRHFNLDLFTEDVAPTAQAGRSSPEATLTVLEEPLPALEVIVPPKDQKDDPKGVSSVGEDFAANQESLDKSTELYSPTAEDEDDEFLDTGVAEQHGVKETSATSSHIDDTSQLVSFGVNSASEEARMLDIPLPPPVQVEAPPTSFRNILQIPAPSTPSPTRVVSEPNSSEKESPAQLRTPIAKITFGKQVSKLKPFKNVFSGDETDSEAESPVKMNEDKVPEKSTKSTKIPGKSKSPDSKASKRPLSKSETKGDAKMSDKRPSTDEVIQRYASEIDEFPLEKTAAEHDRQHSSIPGITKLKSESKGGKTEQGERNGKGQHAEDDSRMAVNKEAIGVNDFHPRHRPKRSRSRDRKRDDRRRRGRRSVSPDRIRSAKRRRGSPRDRRRRSRERWRRDRPRSGSGKRRSVTPQEPAQDRVRLPSKPRETTPIRNSHSREPSLIKTFKEESEFNFGDVVVKEEQLTSDGGGEADSKNANSAEARTVTYEHNAEASEAIEPPRETGFSDWESPVPDRAFDVAELPPLSPSEWRIRGHSPSHFRNRRDNVGPHGSPEFRGRPSHAYDRTRPESPQRTDFKRSISPARKGSFDSNRRSPGPRRKSPGSPVRRESGPGRRRDHSRSPKWRGQNLSPRDRGLPMRPIDRSKRSHSPHRRKLSVSPRRSLMRSPPRRGPGSPLRHPPSPLRKGPSRSPMRRGPSHSPLRRGPSRSPVRRGPKHSPRYSKEPSYSPVRRGPSRSPLMRGPHSPLRQGASRSPMRLRKDSPGRRGPSLSPRRGRSPSPLTRSRLLSHRRFNDSPPAPFYSPLSEKHRSPPRNRSPPPSRRLDASPFRRRSPPGIRSPRSPRHSPRRRRSPTPNRHSPGRRRRSISPYRERNMSPPDRLRRPSPGWSSRGRSPSHSPGMKHPSPFRVRYSPLPSPNRRQGSADRHRSSERRRGTPPRFERSPRRRSYSPSPTRDRDRPSKWSWNEDSTDKFAARNLSEWDDYPRPPPPVGADYQSNQPDSTISDSELVREMTSSPKRLSLDQRIQLELGDILGNSTSDGPYGNNFYNPPPAGQDHHLQHHHPFSYPPPGFPEVPPQNLIYPPIQSGADWSAVPPPPPPAPPPTTTVVQVGNILQVVPSEVPYDVKPSHSKKSRKDMRPPTPALPLPDEHENESIGMVLPKELAGTGSPLPGTSGVQLPGLSPVDSPVLKHKIPLPTEHTSPSLPDPVLAKQEDRERRRREKEARKKKKEEKAAKRMLRKAMLKKRAALLPPDDLPSSPVPRVFITENTTGMTLPTADKGILISAGGGDAKRKMVSFADGIRPGEGTSPSGGEDHHLSPPPRPRKTKRKKKKKKRKVKVRIVRLGRNGDEEEEDEGEPPPPPPSPAPPIAYIDIANLPPGYGFVELSSLGDDPMLLQQYALPPPPPPAVR